MRIFFSPHQTGYGPSSFGTFGASSSIRPPIYTIKDLKTNISLCTPNPGNLIHSESPAEIIKHDTSSSFKGNLFRICKTNGIESTCRYLEDNFDAVCISMANDIRTGWRSDSHVTYADMLDKIKIPVFVFGLGIQDSLQSTWESRSQISDELSRFLSSCNTNASIFSVRGKASEEFLHKIKLKNAQALGCPSMYRNPIAIINSAKDMKPPKSYGRLCSAGYLHSRSRHPLLEKICGHFKSLHYSYILQNDMWSIVNHKVFADPHNIHYDAYTHSPDNSKIKLFVQKLHKFSSIYSDFRYFWNSSAWLAFSSTHDFFIGDRLHACIASMSTGVNSLLLYEDARVQEISEFYNMLSLDTREINADSAGNIAENTISDFDSSLFVKTYLKRLEAFANALKKFNICVNDGIMMTLENQDLYPANQRSTL